MSDLRGFLHSTDEAGKFYVSQIQPRGDVMRALSEFVARGRVGCGVGGSSRFFAFLPYRFTVTLRRLYILRRRGGVRGEVDSSVG
jgi:hypothetical protein